MVRYIGKYSKGSEVKFVSHLDMLRCFQRSIRRARLPISYSHGFNPHADISFATPLPVGTLSSGEYLDIKLDGELDENYLAEVLNKNLPYSIKMTFFKKIDEHFPSLMSIVDSAIYEITLVDVSNEFSSKALQGFLEQEEIQIKKSSKNGDRIVNIRSQIHELELISSIRDRAVFKTILDTGSSSNLSPYLLVSAMKSLILGLGGAQIREIKKSETYFKKDDCVKTLIELL